MVGMAFPGTFMLDRQGRVTSRFFEDFYVDRNTVSSVMLRVGVGTAPVVATKISTGQIEITTFPSDTAVAPGNRFAVAFDVSPHSGIHVYAPGASGYRTISVTIAPQPFVHVHRLQYPQSEIYFFKPLNEKVPTYQKPFTLTQEVVLDASAREVTSKQTSMTIAGALTYQACDDRLCYDPVTLPLSWTVGLKPIVAAPTAARPATK